MHYDVVILGGGISGRMMAKRLAMIHPQLSVCIIDKGDTVEHSFHLHRPIDELNIEWTPHNFFLGIWDNGMRTTMTPKDVNDYALKVYGKLQPSNIVNFSLQQNSPIYPLSKDRLKEVLGVNSEVIKGLILGVKPEEKRVLTDNPTYSEITYTYLINTITLPIFLTLSGISHNTLQFNHYPFDIMTIPMGYNTNLYQMIYNTGPGSMTRATLINENLYVEFHDTPLAEDEEMIETVFGVKADQPIKSFSPGRFDPLPRQERKELYFHLTNAYDIMLLGRYGSWGFKVANDVWDDTKLLCEIISYKEHSRKGAMQCKH